MGGPAGPPFLMQENRTSAAKADIEVRPMSDNKVAETALVTMTEAGRLAGVSAKTIRRWADKGRISLDRSQPRPRVPVAELLRIGVLDHVDTPGVSGHPASEKADIGREAELAELRAEKQRLEQELGRWREQAESLRRSVEQLTETVGQLALPAAREEPAVPADPPGRAARWWAWFWGRGT